MPKDNAVVGLKKWQIYAAYMTLSSVFTAELNVIHTHYILHASLSVASFIVPTFAGLLFGYLLARIKLLSGQLEQLAYTDSLTRIYNRLHFFNLLESEIGRITRYNGTFSIIFFDIDYFKKINDNHGHQVGDNVLVTFTYLIEKANRTTDVFARYGGEEFIILTRETDLAGATKHAENLCKIIAETTFDVVGNVTCSFGVAEFNKEHDDIQFIIKRADTALYSAKANGRNCVMQANE